MSFHIEMKKKIKSFTNNVCSLVFLFCSLTQFQKHWDFQMDHVTLNAHHVNSVID